MCERNNASLSALAGEEGRDGSVFVSALMGINAHPDTLASVAQAARLTRRSDRLLLLPFSPKIHRLSAMSESSQIS